MAEEVQIRGTQEIAKIRNPLAPVLLPYPTIGVYAFVWLYKINKEMAALGRSTGRTNELGDNPGTTLLAILLPAFTLILFPISMVAVWNTYKRQQALRAILTPGDEGVPPWYMFIPLYGIYALQESLNIAWQAQATGAAPAGAVGPGEVAEIPAEQSQPVQ
jgi:hypothetical protein